MNLVDVEDAVLYPSIRDTDSEKDIEIIYTDMVANSTQESTYFPYSFRLNPVVINLLGNQYMRSIDEYSDDEGYIIGELLCDKKNLHRLAKEHVSVKKLLDFLEEKRFWSENLRIFAIYLYESEESSENKQDFLLLTDKKIYIRYDNGMQWEHYGYYETPFYSNVLAANQPCDVFKNFLHDIRRLMTSMISNVSRQHPVCLENFLYRSRYLEFLTKYVVADNSISLFAYNKLEFLARVFGITSRDFLQWLSSAAKVKEVTDTKLKKLVNDFRKDVSSNVQANVLLAYMDALELVWDKNEKFKKIFAQKTYCGKTFYELYNDYLKLKAELLEKQEKLWLQASEEGNDFRLADLTKQLQYNHNIEEQILRIGAEINDVEY